MKWVTLGGVSVLCLLGCSNGQDWMPMQTGTQWTYAVRTPYVQYIEDVTLSEPVAVGHAQGITLKSRFGVSRLGWNSGALVLSGTNGTQFEPPIPLLIGSGGKASREWKGAVSTVEKTTRATAVITQEPDEVTANGREFRAVRSTVKVAIPGQEIEILSWFVRGIGCVRQEQRTGGKLEMRMEWMSGPRTEK